MKIAVQLTTQLPTEIFIKVNSGKVSVKMVRINHRQYVMEDKNEPFQGRKAAGKFYLVKFCCKQVKRCQDSAIWSKIKLLHHFLVLNGVPYINICTIGESHHSRIKVEHITTNPWSLCVANQPVKKSCFSTPCPNTVTKLWIWVDKSAGSRDYWNAITLIIDLLKNQTIVHLLHMLRIDMLLDLACKVLLYYLL